MRFDREGVRGGTVAELVEKVGTGRRRPFAKAKPRAKLRAEQPAAGVVIGKLVAVAREGRMPLVLYPGQPGATAVVARTVVDLQARHVGGAVVLTFEGGDPARPIIMGVLREGEGWPLQDPPGRVEVEADGKRMTVSAKEQLVLRCGKASITLTKAGKVLVEGTYVLTRSSGVNRIKGGSVQIN